MPKAVYHSGFCENTASLQHRLNPGTYFLHHSQSNVLMLTTRPMRVSKSQINRQLLLERCR